MMITLPVFAFASGSKVATLSAEIYESGGPEREQCVELLGQARAATESCREAVEAGRICDSGSLRTTLQRYLATCYPHWTSGQEENRRFATLLRMIGLPEATVGEGFVQDLEEILAGAPVDEPWMARLSAGGAVPPAVADLPADDEGVEALRASLAAEGLVVQQLPGPGAGTEIVQVITAQGRILGETTYPGGSVDELTERVERFRAAPRSVREVPEVVLLVDLSASMIVNDGAVLEGLASDRWWRYRAVSQLVHALAGAPRPPVITIAVFTARSDACRDWYRVVGTEAWSAEDDDARGVALEDLARTLEDGICLGGTDLAGAMDEARSSLRHPASAVVMMTDFAPQTGTGIADEHAAVLDARDRLLGRGAVLHVIRLRRPTGDLTRLSPDALEERAGKLWEGDVALLVKEVSSTDPANDELLEALAHGVAGDTVGIYQSAGDGALDSVVEPVATALGVTAPTLLACETRAREVTCTGHLQRSRAVVVELPLPPRFDPAHYSRAVVSEVLTGEQHDLLLTRGAARRVWTTGALELSGQGLVEVVLHLAPDLMGEQP